MRVLTRDEPRVMAPADGADLTPRQQRVLACVVAEYIATALPVGSDTIVRKYDPGLSPATIRHTLSSLEALGLLYQPHTSAGRVPSDRGYRLYVERLMNGVELSVVEARQIGHQFHQVERDINQWAQLAATVTAQFTGNAAFVTLPRAPSSRLKHVQLIRMSPHAVLLIAVLPEGIVPSQLIATGPVLRAVDPAGGPDGDADADSRAATSGRFDQDQLDQLAQRMGSAYRGRTALEIAESEIAAAPIDGGGDATPFKRQVRDALVSLLRRHDQQALLNVWYDGVRNVLVQPELARAERARDFLALIEQRGQLAQLADAVLRQSDLEIIIGSENPWPSLRDFSLVVARYGADLDGADRARGLIGVVGPTRMDYGKAIAALRYVGDVMGRLWGDLNP